VAGVRVLVVEDEAPLLEQLSAQLRAEGYAVDAAATGAEGLFLGEEYPVDVAVVDVGLPDTSGIQVIRELRARGRRFPVLILTARGRWEDKVEGLEAGADDYLVKPFHPQELLARLRALMRRAAGWSQPVLRCPPVELDTGSRELSVNGQAVELTAYEYRVLEYLMLRSGTVVSKTELSEHLYEEDADRDSNVLEVLIGRLRRKLDPDGNIGPIETLRGQGYRFRLAPSSSR
jgi:two-component system response regulator PhoP